VNLEELGRQSQICSACPLAEHRKNVVFGEGDPHSSLVLVGEGPGDTEDRLGRPFVGRAGQLLDRGLADAGLSREMVYITNTVKCRAANWTGSKATNRPPTPEETESCRRWLVPQLGLIAPKVILCIGSPSAKNLIKKDFRITSERGLYFPCAFAKTAIATLHPSYILRQANLGGDGGYSLFVSDIRKAWETAQKLAERPRAGEPEQQPLF
jgi:uracil-DNA glycosylase family 4